MTFAEENITPDVESGENETTAVEIEVSEGEATVEVPTVEDAPAA